ncbi:hypothetical protein CHS0354_024393 [Potamilus streckersoni]|uniref:Fe2OG dioxygenase domain-containing protein n=1 Tax=Potamilus streckersoni TaxID=2493646 RepID=A0AAE0SVZ0_9BIVA|nr:hypothetical protein CHS0354_024393 [Potamilus streckersoni]
MGEFYVCSCFYTHNFYIKELGLHAIYISKEQFLIQYSKVLKQHGYSTDERIQSILSQLENELQRRENLGPAFLHRKSIIREKYKMLHPEIFQLKTEFLQPEFLNLVNYCKQSDATVGGVMQYLEETQVKNVYAFPVFTDSFCRKLIEELAHFEESDCPKGRSNTMNHYGLSMDEVGFNDFITTLRVEYMQHITRLLFPEWGGGNLDSHKAFIVKYKVGEDIDLGYHYDNAEVTLNVSLTDNYQGGSLYFGDMRTVPLPDTECSEYNHVYGVGILHRGQHMHGALPIYSGVRYNLITWMRSSKIRNQLCPMCNNKPDLVKTVGYGDGFTADAQQITDVCSLT